MPNSVEGAGNRRNLSHISLLDAENLSLKIRINQTSIKSRDNLYGLFVPW